MMKPMERTRTTMKRSIGVTWERRKTREKMERVSREIRSTMNRHPHCILSSRELESKGGDGLGGMELTIEGRWGRTPKGPGIADEIHEKEGERG